MDFQNLRYYEIISTVAADPFLLHDSGGEKKASSCSLVDIP